MRIVGKLRTKGTGLSGDVDIDIGSIEIITRDTTVFVIKQYTAQLLKQFLGDIEKIGYKVE